MKRSFFQPLKRRQAECKFRDKCELYTGTSYTCTHAGGAYCGMYRRLSKETNSEHLIALPQ